MSKYQNYVPQPLAFYRELYTGDRQYQNYRLNQCKGDKSTWRLIIVAQKPGAAVDNPRIRIPVFQIKRSGAALGDSVTEFKLIGLNGQIADTDIDTAGFSIENLNTTPTLDSIVWNGNVTTVDLSGLPIGYYYLKVKDGTNTWYSEVFELEDESSRDATFPAACGSLGWARLEWSTTCIISETINNESPSFQLLLPIDLGQPEYRFKPDSEDDGQGNQVTLFRRLDKRWQFWVMAPEYISDALTSVQMMSSISLNFESGDFLLCRDIEVSVDWNTPCLAKITFAFSAEFLSRTTCC